MNLVSLYKYLKMKWMKIWNIKIKLFNIKLKNAPESLKQVMIVVNMLESKAWRQDKGQNDEIRILSY